MTLSATDEDGAVAVRANGTPLVGYRAETEASKPHVDTLALPPGVQGAGRNLVDTAPHDHKWHLGLFFCQKLVDGINCWASELYDRKDKIHGAASSESHSVEGEDPIQFTDTVTWRSSDGAHLLDDERTVVVHSPTEDAYLVEWEQTLAAVGERRRLGSETLHGHYSGLSIRFCRSLSGGRVRFPDDGTESTPVDELNGTTARWCDYSGSLDGFVGADPAPTAGVALFDHPTNDLHPTSWFLMTEPFGFVAANPTWDRIESIDPGTSLTRRWGVWIHAGTPSRNQIDEAYDRFAPDE